MHVGPATHYPEIGDLDPQIKVEGGDRDFGKKALEEIMSVMERGDPVIVFAGYPDRTGYPQQASPAISKGTQKKVYPAIRGIPH